MANNENTHPMHMPTPDPALKRLEKLVGTWELKGRTLHSKEDNITGWTTFGWMPEYPLDVYTLTENHVYGNPQGSIQACEHTVRIPR